MAEENTPINEENTGESPTINNNITVPPSSVYVNIPDYSEILTNISNSLNIMSNKTEKLSTDFETFSKDFKNFSEDFKKIKEITEEKYEVEKTAPKNYWDTLRHQYFIILMQGILSRTGIFTEDKLISIVSKIVDASIKKMKATTNNS